MSKAASQAGLKVALSGLGGDELFGSYPTFNQVPHMVTAFGFANLFPGFGKALRIVSVPLLKHFTSPKYAGLLEYGGSYGGAYLLRRGMFMPWELPELLDGEMVKEGWRELQTMHCLGQTINGIRSKHLRVSALEMSWYMRSQLLRDADWASIAHSLEVRVPFVDIALMRSVAPLLASACPPTKQDMARTPSKSLPALILNRRKSGFSIPVQQWLIDDEASDGKQGLMRGLRRWAIKVYAQLHI